MALTAERICFRCGKAVPKAAGTYHADLGALLCSGMCSEAADGLRRDYTRSKRGRWRPKVDVLRDLRAVREAPTADKAHASEEQMSRWVDGT